MNPNDLCPDCYEQLSHGNLHRAPDECAACGASVWNCLIRPCHSINQDGPDKGPVVPLCCECAHEDVPCEELWPRIRERLARLEKDLETK